MYQRPACDLAQVGRCCRDLEVSDDLIERYDLRFFFAQTSQVYSAVFHFARTDGEDRRDLSV